MVPLGGVGPPFDAYKATVVPLNYSGEMVDAARVELATSSV